MVSVDGYSMTLQEAIDNGVLVDGASATQSYTTQAPNPGHSGNNIYVSVDGNEMSLQQAIDSSLCGSVSSSYKSEIIFGHSADEILVSVDGAEMTLQEAINSGEFCLTCVSNFGDSCGASACVNAGTIACDGVCTGTSNKPAGTSCGTGYECDGNGNCESVCPVGYELFGASCILKDEWTDSGSMSGDLGTHYYSWARLYSATAETRMYNGIRQVRIAQCHVMGGDCTSDWSNDVASCIAVYDDVRQYGCIVAVTDRYEAKLNIGNLYAGMFSPIVEGITFGPRIPTPAGAKGDHAGSCKARGYFVNCKDSACTELSWPGTCIKYNDYRCLPSFYLYRCECESGYRLLYRQDLTDNPSLYRYECVKN